LAEGIATAIKACTGCLRHPRADCGATRRPAADYRATTGDLQELASVTVCARQPRRGALPPSRPTHSQAARAMSLPGHLTEAAWRMSALRQKRPFPGVVRFTQI